MNTRTEGLDATVKRITGVDPNWIRQAELRQLQLTKPPGSLGRLEEVANRCAGIQRTLSPSVENPTILLFAADHGVCAEGVNPYPQAVTAQMVVNFLKHGAAINALLGMGQGEANELVRSYRSGLIDQGVAPATINRRLSALRSLVSLGKEFGYITFDLATKNV